MTAEEVLARAAELVERPDGWTQGVFADTDGRVCARGAIYVACGWNTANDLQNDADLRANAEVSIDCHMALLKETGGTGIADWNDEPGRTAIEVSTALRNAKAHLEPRP